MGGAGARRQLGWTQREEERRRRSGGGGKAVQIKRGDCGRGDDRGRRKRRGTCRRQSKHAQRAKTNVFIGADEGHGHMLRWVLGRRGSEAVERSTPLVGDWQCCSGDAPIANGRGPVDAACQ